MVLDSGQRGLLVKRCYVAEVHSGHSPGTPVGGSSGWARARDDADRMTAGVRRGECQCGQVLVPHDLGHTHTRTHARAHTYFHIKFIEGVQKHELLQ